MEIGSKLAILDLEKVKDMDNYYKATLIENVYNSRIPYTNKWEIQKYYGIMIRTDLPIEKANFDKKIEPEIHINKNGEPFEIKKPKYSFERISNPQNSVIRVLEFKFEKNNAYSRNGKPIMRNDMNMQKVNEIFTITQCEFDCIGWKLPEKKVECKIKYMEKKHEMWKKRLIEMRKERKMLKDKICHQEQTIIALREKNARLNKNKEIVDNDIIDKEFVKATIMPTTQFVKSNKRKKTIDYSEGGFDE